MRPLCIYHANCADGFAAAWVVRGAFNGEVDFFEGRYQDDPPDVTNRSVVIVDFSYKRPVLLKMAAAARDILILDHHKSAAEDLVDLPTNVQAVFDMERSGAMIAWDFYFSIEPPQLIKHIQDRDLWRFEMPGTREIQSALFSYPYEFDVWEKLMTCMLPSLQAEGAAIDRKHQKDIQEFIKVAGHRIILLGHNVPGLNVPYCWASDAGHIMCQGEPFAACWYFTGAGATFSLRSDDEGADVSEIAKHFGGGGHRNAAGFRLTGEEWNAAGFQLLGGSC